MKVLVLDDDKIVVKLVHLILEPEGHIVESVKSIAGAIRKIKADPPDVCLLDLHLDMETAYDYLNARAKDEELKNVPVFIISASKQQIDIITTNIRGASNYILKPFNKKVLLEKLATL